MKEVPMETARRPVQWRRAARALRELINDTSRTDLAFEVTYALGGNSGERLFQRFLARADGQRLLAERPALLAALADREALGALPAGSLGRAYLDFLRGGELSAEGLVEASEMPQRPQDVGADRQWFFDRLRDNHDLWHVLTGYGRDEAGEAANLAFTLGQTGDTGVAFMVLAAAWIGGMAPEISPEGVRRGWFHWQRYLYQAWRRGRRAAFLPAVRFEELLREPLEEVRRTVGIEPAEVVHPDGIIVGNRSDEAPPVAGPAPVTTAAAAD
jgi:ubiquinone biosynthesis protein COQ4